MAPQSQARPGRRRRRKRRNVSSSDSSSSESSSSSGETAQISSNKTPHVERTRPSTSTLQDTQRTDDESENSDTDSSELSSFVAQERSTFADKVTQSLHESTVPSLNPLGVRPELPPPLEEISIPTLVLEEQTLEERFQKFWMEVVVDGFTEDLKEIRKQEPNLSTSRLAMLIDALSSGSSLYTSSFDSRGVNELELIMPEQSTS